MPDVAIFFKTTYWRVPLIWEIEQETEMGLIKWTQQPNSRLDLLLTCDRFQPHPNRSALAE